MDEAETVLKPQENDVLVISKGHMYRVPWRPFNKVSPTRADLGQTIVFVKRVCETAPHDRQYDGMITQDLLRVCVDRASYLNAQQPCLETRLAIFCIRLAWWFFEKRAWIRHKRKLSGKKGRTPFVHWVPFAPWNMENHPVNVEGHIEPLEKKSYLIPFPY